MVSTEEKKKIRLLFVCLGNICRSPAAESIMTSLVDKNGLQEQIEVDSAGTSGWHEGELPDERMRFHGEKRGYTFNTTSRKFRESDFDNFDYILVMDKQIFDKIKSEAKLSKKQGAIEKIHLMTEYSRQYTHYNHIPDPYYGNAQGFELVLDLLEDACEGLLQSIKKLHHI